MTNHREALSRGRGTTQQTVQRSPQLRRGDQAKRKVSKIDLHKTEQLFWTTFDRAAVGIAHTSLQGRWLRCNQQLCTLLGYSRDELSTRTVQDLTHPDDLAATLACYHHLLAGEQDAEELDKRYIRKDGMVLWAHLTISLVRTAGRRPDYFITTVQDMTERKHLEQERARLLEWERTARQEAEAANAQLQALQALTDTALSHLALDDLLHELLCRVTDVMSVDQVGILLLDEDAQMLTLQAACGLLETAPGYDRFAMGQGFPGRIAASREPLITNAPSADDWDGSPPALREWLHSAAGVPLLVQDPKENQVAAQLEGQLVGVLIVGSATPCRFTDVDVQLLQRVADRIALAIDRTHLYAAEQEARQQANKRAERLHTILETMADGVAVYDKEGRPMQLVNRAYRELVALERGPAEYESLTTVDRARLLQVRNSVTGAPLPFEDTPAGRALRGQVVTGPSADIRARAFDGRELELNSSAAPLRDPEGQIEGAVLVLRDMSERNQLAREREAALTHAELQAEELDRIFEAAADGLIVYDPEGRIVRENPAARRILALDAAPPGFRQLPERERFARYVLRDEQGRAVPPEDSSLMRARHANEERGSTGHTEPEAFEVRMRALDGREIELNTATAPLWDREGRLVGAVSVLHDLTERNRLARDREAAHANEMAAREASRQMEAFLAVAAHDLRTPLTATVGFIDLAQRQAVRLEAAAREENPDLTRHIAEVLSRLEHAGQSTTRLRRLLALLFDTATIRAGKLELHRAPVDLADLVREQVEA
jgi:PAS domain S-box-containing protein